MSFQCLHILRPEKFRLKSAQICDKMFLATSAKIKLYAVFINIHNLKGYTLISLKQSTSVSLDIWHRRFSVYFFRCGKLVVCIHF